MDIEIFDMVKELQQIRIDVQNNQQKTEDIISRSLQLVDSLHHRLKEIFDLTTAVALCKAGYFVRHIDFSSRESMHYFDGALYYEDGMKVSVPYLQEHGLGDNWQVKKNPLELDLVKLRNLHVESEGELLDIGSYEECFK